MRLCPSWQTVCQSEFVARILNPNCTKSLAGLAGLQKADEKNRIQQVENRKVPPYFLHFFVNQQCKDLNLTFKAQFNFYFLGYFW